MCDEYLLHSTKTILKYLINNGPPYQTVDSIHYDFYNYARIVIPFYDLGFSSLLTFFQSIPDILQVDLATLEVRSSKTSQHPLMYSPLPLFANSSSLQSNRFVHTPMSFPRVLPWARTTNELIESYKRLCRPLSIKKPQLNTGRVDGLATSFPIGPRSHGDGKCSSSESLTPDLDFNDKLHDQFVTFEKVSMLPKYADDADDLTDDDHKLTMQNTFDVSNDNCFRFSDCSSSAPTELDRDDKMNFVGGEVLQKSLSSSSSVMVDESALSPYSEEENRTIEQHIDRKDSYDYDRDYYLSSPEEKVSTCSSNHSAIPFPYSEIDERIIMLTSSFFNEKYGARYETTNIADIMEVGSVYEVFVSEVNSPYKFWFQLGDEEPNPVDELQEHLDMCYTMTDFVPALIKIEHLKRGYACAALYNNIWHRGEIQGYPTDGKVTIYFVDYGTVDQVSIDSVRYILSSFCSTPKLCHRGTLDFVKPVNCRWNVETTSFFISLVTDRKLIAGVSEIDHKTNSVRVYLMYNQTNINRLLVFEGYAFPDDPRERYQTHIADADPSFAALEKAERATFSEVFSLMEQNYDYEKLIIDTSIIDDFDCFIPTLCSEKETFQRMQDFQEQKKEAKRLAQQRDSKMFLQFFGNILNNPFFNETIKEEMEENVQGTNPFLD